MALNKAELIIVSTKYTNNLIPNRYLFKTITLSQIGISFNNLNTKNTRKRNKKILYVGKFLYLKGMSIGLEAFAKALEYDKDLKLSLVGRGPEIKKWKNISDKLNITNNVEWYEWSSKKELENFYKSHGVFLFPSLHDSAGQVLLEAMINGLVPICLNLGGPGVLQAAPRRRWSRRRCSLAHDAPLRARRASRALPPCSAPARPPASHTAAAPPQIRH